MNKITELFTESTQKKNITWNNIISEQQCKYISKKCIKNRKSEPEISIGTCTVNYGKEGCNIIICPFRLLERRQIFMDCIHLLKGHEPGNELHIVPEVSIPGGNVDYFLVSTDSNRKIKDFVGIELQTMDTTGTVWPERQRFLQEQKIEVLEKDILSSKSFGINWKMTAKTILIQIHHKIDTFEHLNKHLVLVIQDCLLNYIKKEFTFSQISDTPKLGDSMHFHSYKIAQNEEKEYRLKLDKRYSTDRDGISILLGLQAEANIELDAIIRILETKISDSTLFTM